MQPIKRQRWYMAFRERAKAIRRRLKLPQYRGDEFRCPMCGTGLNRFRPIWKSFRRAVAEHGYVHPMSKIETLNVDNYSCPACDASDRERLYVIFLEQELAKRDPSRRYRFMDFAPGHALRRWLTRQPLLDYRTADLVRPDVDEQADITNMPQFRDGSVDMLLCSHMLEHIPDDRSAMRELHRILAPDGLGIVMVPLLHGVDETEEDPAINTRALRWKYYMDGDHVRQYGKADFLRRLEAAGFAVDRLDIAYFGAETARRAGLAADSVLYVVRKGGGAGSAPAPRPAINQ